MNGVAFGNLFWVHPHIWRFSGRGLEGVREVECPANSVTGCMRQTGTGGACCGVREEAQAASSALASCGGLNCRGEREDNAGSAQRAAMTMTRLRHRDCSLPNIGIAYSASDSLHLT
jgi:hypothetical protein